MFNFFQTVDANEIYEALVQDHSVLGPEYLKKLRNYRHELNIRQTAWDRLATETDASLLSGENSLRDCSVPGL